MDVKQQVYQACLKEIGERIALSKKALDEAIAAGNDETKSSAGDKYETGRAMMQMEQDKHRGQLFKLQQLQNELEQLDLNKPYTSVLKGAIVFTSNGIFFISIGIGKIMIDGSPYFVISTEAPLSKSMIGLQKGASFSFQNRVYQIEEIA